MNSFGISEPLCDVKLAFFWIGLYARNMADTRNSTYRSYDYFKMHSQKLAAAHAFFNISTLSQDIQATILCVSRYIEWLAEISINVPN